MKTKKLINWVVIFVSISTFIYFGLLLASYSDKRKSENLFTAEILLWITLFLLAFLAGLFVSYKMMKKEIEKIEQKHSREMYLNVVCGATDSD